MAWLNLNVEFGYGWSEVWDWDSDYNDEIICETDNGIKYITFPVNTKPLPCDDYPFRSHMKNKYDYWGYKNWEKAKDVGLWRFIHYVIEKNINKSFDGAFRYFCKFAKPYLQKYFLESFNNYMPIGRDNKSYWIDEEGIIRAHDYRHKKYISRREGKTETFFVSHDYEEIWEIEVIQSSWWNRKDQVFNITISLPKGDMHMWGVKREFNYTAKLKPLKLLNTKGIKQKFENKRARDYQKLRAEDNKKIRKKEREEERLKKNKVYSLKPSFLNETSRRAI
jgi:hypothetical protein